MNQEYINKITIEYLLNPNISNKKPELVDNCNLEKDIKFYRKRICQLTKDMTHKKYPNDNIKLLFCNFASQIIYFLKQQDEKDLYQEEYLDLSINTIKNSDSDKDFGENIENLDNLLINYPEQKPNLDNFVKKINIPQNDTIIPKRKVINIKDPTLKTKGVKKKENLS